MPKKIMTVGIISRKEYMRRTIAIAKGDYVPKRGEPKVWFESLKSMSQVLSQENQHLLRQIIQHKPRSITELEEITSRKKSNLCRTLKTLEKYGIVDLPKVKGRIVPKVKATDFKVEFGLNTPTPVPAEGNNHAFA